jgi:hypothetical protein
MIAQSRTYKALQVPRSLLDSAITPLPSTSGDVLSHPAIFPPHLALRFLQVLLLLKRPQIAVRSNVKHVPI